MKKQKFYIVDVFAEKRFNGNPLAVLPGADNLSSDYMLSLAKEFNFSETVFISTANIQQKPFPIRIFTPKQEIPFAGHPVLGTACIIRQRLMERPENLINLKLQSGPMTVSVEHFGESQEIFWMKQAQPEFGDVFPPETIAEALGLSPVDLHPHFPVQAVSTGLPQIVVPLASPSALSNIAIQEKKYRELISQSEAKILLAFCGHCTDSDIDAIMRVFPIYFGIPEDPATGSGAGCLAGYLIKHNYYKTRNLNLKVSQGREINRPSLLRIKAHQLDHDIQIHVGGSVIEVAEGDLISAS